MHQILSEPVYAWRSSRTYCSPSSSLLIADRSDSVSGLVRQIYVESKNAIPPLLLATNPMSEVLYSEA